MSSCTTRRGFLWVSLPWDLKFSVSGHNAAGGACTQVRSRDALRWYLEEINYSSYFLSCAPARQTLIYGGKGRGPGLRGAEESTVSQMGSPGLHGRMVVDMLLEIFA